MEHDRDEWRRPWRQEDTPWLRRATTAPEHEAPTAGREDPAEPPAENDIARFPQPPPPSWDEQHAGPGSPAGSVRPPDTIGTVDAPAPRRRRGGLLTALLAALLGAVVGTVGTFAALTTVFDGVSGSVSAPQIEINGDAESVVQAVAQAVTPSVVSISIGVAPQPFGNQQAQGSGVIYRSDGYILTNNHVVEHAEGPVRVRLANGDVLDGEVIGTDPLSDLAVVQIERDGLPAINLRPEDEPLQVGETAVAIGSPFGLEGSVTAGVVSALDRELVVEEEADGVLVIPSVVQTDAAINPGNSGGALVDARGRLIGINTAILTRTGASQGVGFAVPVDQAVISGDQLIEQGFVRHPLLGVGGQDVTPEIVEEFDLDVSRGAIVNRVQEGSGADDSGMEPGDIIVAVDGSDIATMSQLIAEVRRRAPGEVVELEVIRDGERMNVEVELGERPR